MEASPKQRGPRPSLAPLRRWPVRWRLAAVSAGLTLIILLIFAAVIGSLTSDRIRSDFREDVRSAATDFAFNLALDRDLSPEEVAAMTAGDAAFRILDENNVVEAESRGAPNLGPANPGVVTEVGGYQVATAQEPTFSNDLGQQLFVQYARPIADVQETVDRLWLFLFAGVALGTVLAADRKSVV